MSPLVLPFVLIGPGSSLSTNRRCRRVLRQPRFNGLRTVKQVANEPRTTPANPSFEARQGTSRNPTGGNIHNG